MLFSVISIVVKPCNCEVRFCEVLAFVGFWATVFTRFFLLSIPLLVRLLRFLKSQLLLILCVRGSSCIGEISTLEKTLRPEFCE